jgi:hypothetical protein
MLTTWHAFVTLFCGAAGRAEAATAVVTARRLPAAAGRSGFRILAYESAVSMKRHLVGGCRGDRPTIVGMTNDRGRIARALILSCRANMPVRLGPRHLLLFQN